MVTTSDVTVQKTASIVSADGNNSANGLALDGNAVRLIGLDGNSAQVEVLEGEFSGMNLSVSPSRLGLSAKSVEQFESFDSGVQDWMASLDSGVSQWNQNVKRSMALLGLKEDQLNAGPVALLPVIGTAIAAFVAAVFTSVAGLLSSTFIGTAISTLVSGVTMLARKIAPGFFKPNTGNSEAVVDFEKILSKHMSPEQIASTKKKMGGRRWKRFAAVYREMISILVKFQEQGKGALTAEEVKTLYNGASPATPIEDVVKKAMEEAPVHIKEKLKELGELERTQLFSVVTGTAAALGGWGISAISLANLWVSVPLFLVTLGATMACTMSSFYGFIQLIDSPKVNISNWPKDIEKTFWYNFLS